MSTQPQTTAPFELTPISQTFGASVGGLDLNAPVGPQTWAAIHDAFLRHRLLLFRGQSLEPERIVDWSKRFGVTERHLDAAYLLEGHPEIIVIGNLRENGRMRSLFVNAREEWHFDYSYTPNPALGALFYAVTVPPAGGDTLFADSTAAYDALSPEMKARIEPLRGLHSWSHLHRMLEAMDPSRPPLTAEQVAAHPEVAHPLVHVHPETGRRSLWICPQVIRKIEGLSEAESAELLEELQAHATQPQFTYRHRWQEGDLLVYDNRALLHSATVFDHERHLRVMYRTTILQEMAAA
jgi:taurine dioxygenase